MGECFSIIGDLDATPENAEATAARITQWLIAEGIIEAELTDRGWMAGAAYAPGPNAQLFDPDIDDTFAGVDGVEICVEPKLHLHLNEWDYPMICPSCSERHTTDGDPRDPVGGTSRTGLRAASS